MKETATYLRAKDWIYKNARPIDYARWKYHFENGSIDSVLSALEVYQNKDGGFGHGLEPDFWNPNSSPMQTWTATEILHEINFKDKTHPVIGGILDYLNSSKDFFHNKWSYSIPANNDFPHAPWWHCLEYPPKDENMSYLPAACFAGFALVFADEKSDLYIKCKQIAEQAVKFYLDSPLITDMHIVTSYVRMTEYICRADINGIEGYDMFIEKLKQGVKESICYDIDKWSADYVCMPSQHISSRISPFYSNIKDIAEYQAEFLVASQKESGMWDTLWEWGSYPKEYAVSQNWWKSHFVILNMLYLKNFDALK